MESSPDANIHTNVKPARLDEIETTQSTLKGCKLFAGASSKFAAGDAAKTTGKHRNPLSQISVRDR